MHCLYLIATPIGNLEDITFRAIRVLGEVGIIAAEDTRKTRQLLKKYNIDTPVTSFYEHSSKGKEDYILSQLEETDVAVVSEAGMPGISDPGYELVIKAIGRGARIIPVPGASAVITALAASGLPTDRFCYLGFLPRKKTDRRRAIESVAFEQGSIVIFEAPHRLINSLNDIMTVLGDRHIAVAREMTKLFEEIFRGSISQAIGHFSSPRGEFTLVVEGYTKLTSPTLTEEALEQLADMKKAGIKARQAVQRISDQQGVSRRTVYQAWLEIEKD